MAEHEPVDATAPWTIKSIGVATREAVTRAARREGLTVGQWLERRVAEWEADGSPVAIAGPAMASTAPQGPSMGELADMTQAALAAAAAAGVAVPPTFARDAMLTARRAMRAVRSGSPQPRPKQLGAPEVR